MGDDDEKDRTRSSTDGKQRRPNWSCGHGRPRVVCRTLQMFHLALVRQPVQPCSAKEIRRPVRPNGGWNFSATTTDGAVARISGVCVVRAAGGGVVGRV